MIVGRSGDVRGFDAAFAARNRWHAALLKPVERRCSLHEKRTPWGMSVFYWKWIFIAKQPRKLGRVESNHQPLD
jgi:hypothetical protein